MEAVAAFACDVIAPNATAWERGRSALRGAFEEAAERGLCGNIARDGGAAQREAHLPDLLAAKRIGALLLTEPKGGSDAAATETSAARLLDAGGDAVMAAAQAKKFATQVALRRPGDCMQAMGAEGFKADHPVARHFAGAKMVHYVDGTTEFPNVVITRGLFAEGG